MRALVADALTKPAAVANSSIAATGDEPAVTITGGDAAITFTKTPVRAAAGSVLVIRNRTGAVSFDAQSPLTATAATHDAIVVETTRDALQLAAPVALTTNGARALALRNAGTVTIAGGTIDSSGAAAVDIVSSALDVTLTKLDVDGRGTAAVGMSLDNTTGRFSVAGGSIRNVKKKAIALNAAKNVTLAKLTLSGNVTSDGGASGEACLAASGDAAALCNAVIALRDTDGVTLEGVVVDGSKQFGILALGAANLTISNSEVKHCGDDAHEPAVVLRNGSGRTAIVNSRIHDNFATAIFIDARGEAKPVVEITHAAITSSPRGGIELRAADASDVRITVTGSTFDKAGSAINLAATGAAKVRYRIADNPSITGSTSSAINLFLGAPSSGSMTGSVVGNTIGRSGAAGSGAQCGSCDGIAITASGSGRLTAAIRNNVIQQVDGSGIRAVANSGSASLAVAITGNTIREPFGQDAGSAIHVQSGASSRDTTNVCADIGGAGALANNISGAWDPSGEGAGIAVANRFAGTKLRIAGAAAAPKPSDVVAHLRGRNRAGAIAARVKTTEPMSAFSGGDACTTPEEP